jgi:hypothetical protein
MTFALTLVCFVTFVGGLLWICLRKSRKVTAGAMETLQWPSDASETARAVLIPLTDEARSASSAAPTCIDRYPFRVGRESRINATPYVKDVNERHKSNTSPNNDLYLLDALKKLHISREHFQIETRPDGGYDLVDRNSACGTLVGKKAVGGGDKGGRCTLVSGDNITIGTKSSPYIFRFLVKD